MKPMSMRRLRICLGRPVGKIQSLICFVPGSPTGHPRVNGGEQTMITGIGEAEYTVGDDRIPARPGSGGPSEE